MSKLVFHVLSFLLCAIPVPFQVIHVLELAFIHSFLPFHWLLHSLFLSFISYLDSCFHLVDFLFLHVLPCGQISNLSLLSQRCPQFPTIPSKGKCGRRTKRPKIYRHEEMFRCISEKKTRCTSDPHAFCCFLSWGWWHFVRIPQETPWHLCWLVSKHHPSAWKPALRSEPHSNFEDVEEAPDPSERFLFQASWKTVARVGTTFFLYPVPWFSYMFFVRWLSIPWWELFSWVYKSLQSNRFHDHPQKKIGHLLQIPTTNKNGWLQNGISSNFLTIVQFLFNLWHKWLIPWLQQKLRGSRRTRLTSIIGALKPHVSRVPHKKLRPASEKKRTDCVFFYGQIPWKWMINGCVTENRLNP